MIVMYFYLVARNRGPGIDAVSDGLDAETALAVLGDGKATLARWEARCHGCHTLCARSGEQL